jgi:hypothetical protein
VNKKSAKAVTTKGLKPPSRDVKPSAIAAADVAVADATAAATNAPKVSSGAVADKPSKGAATESAAKPAAVAPSWKPVPLNKAALCIRQGLPSSQHSKSSTDDAHKKLESAMDA